MDLKLFQTFVSLKVILFVLFLFSFCKEHMYIPVVQGILQQHTNKEKCDNSNNINPYSSSYNESCNINLIMTFTHLNYVFCRLYTKSQKV